MRSWAAFLLISSAGCVSVPPTKAAVGSVDRPPAPKSVSLAHPGGDASDPERAALSRLAAEPFDFKPDRWGTMNVHLADVVHWSRTHIFGVKTRAAFHYGDERYAVATVYYLPAEKG